MGGYGGKEEARAMFRKGLECQLAMYLGADEKPLKNSRRLHD